MTQHHIEHLQAQVAELRSENERLRRMITEARYQVGALGGMWFNTSCQMQPRQIADWLEQALSNTEGEA